MLMGHAKLVQQEAFAAPVAALTSEGDGTCIDVDGVVGLAEREVHVGYDAENPSLTGPVLERPPPAEGVATAGEGVARSACRGGRLRGW